MSDKAGRYISQLDAARCDGRWNEVPELARKVEKYAPSRKCLVTTARAEAKVATQPTKRPATGARPTTAKSEKIDKSLISLVRELEAAIEFEKHNAEDKFQAQTCLAWLYWNNSDYRNAKAVVPQTMPQSANGKRLSDWTTVCIVKASFFRASSEEGLKNLSEVPTVYGSCLNNLEALPAPSLGIVEFCFWWERFFSRCCGCFYGIFQEKSKIRRANIDTKACLQAYRAWSSNWDHLAGTLNNESSTAKQKRNQRLLVWKSYYHVLSDTLQYGYAYPPPIKTEPLRKEGGVLGLNKKRLLILELGKVESQYESLLLRQVSFPEASHINTEVDEWVNSLMTNWISINGPGWSEDDLGQGGRTSANRRVLESLYKAATLTFHSTSVLRHLFTLHTTLAEFDLAEKALDSYLEIVLKGKARVAKSGVDEPDLDSDELMLQTIASGIEMLCEFGKAKQVEKSVALSRHLITWLEDHNPTTGPSNPNSSGRHSAEDIRVEPQILALVHRAIALSKASWARLSFESKDRAKLQADAIKHLKIALRTDHAAEEDPTFLYPLALILAETRNIEGAVAVIKQALTAESRTFSEPLDQNSFSNDTKTQLQRSSPTVECWHLLSLLLSSRQEFETAEVASQNALEQYENSSRSLVNSENAKKLSFFQKKQIVEAKMTQIALAEITEGSQDAVNASAELLSLYSRLVELPKAPQQTTKTEKPPPTATGTIKSFRGSIFGRNRKSVRNSEVSLPQTNSALEDPLPPTIAVTADGSSSPHPITPAPIRTPSHKLQKRRSRHSFRRSRNASPTRVDDSISVPTASVISDVQPDTSSQLRPPSTYSNDPSEVGIAVSHDYPTVQTAQVVSFQHAQALTLDGHASSKAAKSPEVPEFSPVPFFENRSPFYIPAPMISAAEEQTYGIALLNSIWLFVSALYRRGGMLEDARQAMDEAFKQAKLAEAAVAKPGPSSVKLFDKSGWGGVKSVEEIWADSYAEMGHLCVAEGDPYEAMTKYEGALSHCADHAGATVALANILLDINAKKIPLTRKQASLATEVVAKPDNDDSSQPVFSKTTLRLFTSRQQTNGVDSAVGDGEEAEEGVGLNGTRQSSTEELDLLASRDRAYSLLSNLTKLGTGWDDSDAWFALAAAYEASGQVEKAKEVLWWVVELEEKRPVRHWRVLGQGYKIQR